LAVALCAREDRRRCKAFYNRIVSVIRNFAVSKAHFARFMD